jgi:hypothetical protein
VEDNLIAFSLSGPALKTPFLERRIRGHRRV